MGFIIWRRTGAYLIDGFLIGAVTVLLSMIGIGSSYDIAAHILLIFFPTTLPILLTSMVYFLLFAYFNEGRTLGKLLLNIEIESLDGGKLERSKLMLREGVKVLLLPGLILSFALCLFTSDNLSFHDYIMNTIVIKNV